MMWTDYVLFIRADFLLKTDAFTYWRFCYTSDVK